MKRDGKEYFFEIKTVKPNIDVFTKSKTKLLEWIARKRQPIKAILAFPYNPYHPEPYKRFTEQNLMQMGVDFLVGEEYWNFLNGKNTFPELLEIFDSVGKDWKDEILAKIEEVAKLVFNTPANPIKPHKHWVLLFDITNFRLKKLIFHPKKADISS